jgi:hypothetical protein
LIDVYFEAVLAKSETASFLHLMKFFIRSHICFIVFVAMRNAFAVILLLWYMYRQIRLVDCCYG